MNQLSRAVASSVRELVGIVRPDPAIATGPRILVLSAGFGEGHNAAARALVEAADEQLGTGAARLVDAFALASPRLNGVSRRAYLTMINRTPRLWSAIYGWMDRTPRASGLFNLLGAERRVLQECLRRDRPSVLCSTYPVYGYMLDQLARAGVPVPPLYNVVTDSISINSLWWRAPCAGWFLPNPDSTAVLAAAGIPAHRLRTTGFPVAGFFAANAGHYIPDDLAAGAAPRVLYILNSGTRDALATARALFAEEGWEITCAVGRDAALQRALEKLAYGRARPVNILGWTDQIPRLLMTHHVVVSKAGGATTQEAIAAKCPMVVTQIVPGQEEGNYELLRRHGIGGRAETPAALLSVLRGAFMERGARWYTWRESLEMLSQPRAARAILDILLTVPGADGPENAAGGNNSCPTPVEHSIGSPP